MMSLGLVALSPPKDAHAEQAALALDLGDRKQAEHHLGSAKAMLTESSRWLERHRIKELATRLAENQPPD